MSIRAIHKVLPAQATQDGAGVKLLRALGYRQGVRMDPFLMLDAFSSDDPDDYIAGFPPHPHRGFETITYIVDGHMRHRDHLGNAGDLRAGGVQWMTAGRGIIHEEMPQQENGLLRGFQIWLNLPAADKMQPASYRDIPASEICHTDLPAGGFIKLIAGSIGVAGVQLQGPGQGNQATAAIIADIYVGPEQQVDIAIPASHNALLYVFAGTLQGQNGQDIPAEHSVWYESKGASVRVQAASTAATGVRVLLLAGKPLNEPIAQYGPFVMNTSAEVEQALRDYRDGTLAI